MENSNDDEIEMASENDNEEIMSEGDSSSDDSEVEREEQNVIERRVVELRKTLSKTPYSYDLHLELINALKKLGEFDLLQHAREAMSRLYPLTEELWLDWIHDETKLASTPKEVQDIERLFCRANEDYLSCNVLLEYVKYSLTGSDSTKTESLDKVRGVMESVVTNGGLHVAKGALLWGSYRDYEIGVYLAQQTVEENANQAKKVTQLFQRQLSIPLIGMQDVWIEYKEWIELSDQKEDPSIEASYEKALNNLQKFLKFEDNLSVAEDDASKAVIYKEYLEIETNDFKDPARIQAMYERVVAELPLYEIFWIGYYQFANQQLKSGELTCKILHRATRNCSWSSSIWTDYINMSENYEKEHGFISGLVEKAFAVGLASAADYRNVWVAFIDFLVRKCRKSSWSNDSEVESVREAFTRAIDHLSQAYGVEGDPECILLQYWAKLEAKWLKNLEKARMIWKDVISQGRGKFAQWWLALIQFERIHGNDAEELRRIFSRSINAISSTDWPELVIQQWLQFEREDGDLASFNNARQKSEARMKKVAEEREKNRAVEAETAAQEKPTTTRKRTKDGKGDTKAPASKKSKSNGADTVVPVEPAIVVPKRPDDPLRLARTVFISNLDFNITEDEIRQALSSSGNIVEVRMVPDFKQRSKGYCYVEFSTDEETEAVLKRDREPLKGRPMFISPYEQDKSLKTPIFKFQNSLERKKLFVKGLSTDATKEDVEKLFGQYGTLKEVRIVTYRSGRSKGIAYVEYEDEVSAKTALTKTDGTTFMELELNVAISNPPPRLNKSNDDGGLSLGGGPRVRKSQVSFVPNAVLKQTSSSSNKPMQSNADFRSMLLKK